MRGTPGWIILDWRQERKQQLSYSSQGPGKKRDELSVRRSWSRLRKQIYGGAEPSDIIQPKPGQAQQKNRKQSERQQTQTIALPPPVAAPGPLSGDQVMIIRYVNKCISKSRLWSILNYIWTTGPPCYGSSTQHLIASVQFEHWTINARQAAQCPGAGCGDVSTKAPPSLGRTGDDSQLCQVIPETWQPNGRQLKYLLKINQFFFTNFIIYIYLWDPPRVWTEKRHNIWP